MNALECSAGNERAIADGVAPCHVTMRQCIEIWIKVVEVGPTIALDELPWKLASCLGEWVEIL